MLTATRWLLFYNFNFFGGLSFDWKWEVNLSLRIATTIDHNQLNLFILKMCSPSGLQWQGQYKLQQIIYFFHGSMEAAFLEFSLERIICVQIIARIDLWWRRTACHINVNRWGIFFARDVVVRGMSNTYLTEWIKWKYCHAQIYHARARATHTSYDLQLIFMAFALVWNHRVCHQLRFVPIWKSV